VARRRVGGAIAALCLCFFVASDVPAFAQDVSKQRDGSLLIAGRNLRCGGARNVVDPHLPNLGLAAPGVLIMNPRLLNRWPATVRLFVFHHECGHHHVGASETGADCWAVKQGVRAGWLDRASLQQICRSFGNGPATATHPSGAVRCASLDRCFATAVVAAAPKGRSAPAGGVQATTPGERSTATGEATAGPAGPNAAPKLIYGPTLKRSGMNPN
jgi:hypothetical protein